MFDVVAKSRKRYGLFKCYCSAGHITTSRHSYACCPSP